MEQCRCTALGHARHRDRIASTLLRYRLLVAKRSGIAIEPSDGAVMGNEKSRDS
jgi:hypothetical protein